MNDIPSHTALNPNIYYTFYSKMNLSYETEAFFSV